MPKLVGAVSDIHIQLVTTNHSATLASIRESKAASGKSLLSMSRPWASVMPNVQAAIGALGAVL
jgi:hypothetical protein